MAKKTIADAYVNLIPSAEGFSQKVSKAIDEGTTEGAKVASGGFSNLMTGFAMGIGQAAFGVVEDLGKKAFEVAKSSISAFADYEQLSGGVETLFGKQMKMADYIQNASVSAAQAVKDYRFIGTGEAQLMQDAAEAYKTAGLSANEYMELSIQSAASMISSLHGNTEKAAKLVNMSIVDMADNVNKMGTSMESVQNAYRGFAKGNFTMLDNLALGYGGTKEEMERLLEDATKLSGVKYDMDSYSDIVQAIHVIQEEMGVAGTTAEEASTTIQGSLGMVKASWENLIAGLANEDADLGNLFDQLLETVFGKEGGEGEERTKGFLDNILPRIEQVVSGFGEFIQLASAKLPDVFEKYLPGIVKSLLNIIQNVITSLTDNSDSIIESLGNVYKTFVENAFKLLKSLLSALPVILEVALQIVVTLANGLADFIPELVPTLIDVVVAICDVILDNIFLIIDAAKAIIIAIVDGLLGNLDKISMAMFKITWELVAHLILVIPQIIGAAVEIIEALVTSLVNSFLNMLSGDYWNDTLNVLVHSFTDLDWDGVGYNIIDGIVQGFKSGWSKLLQTAENTVNSLMKIFTDGFDIHSPSRVFEEYGEMLDKGLAIGIDSGDSIDATEQLARNINGEFSSAIGDFNASSNTDDAQILNLLSEQNSLLWQILNKNYGRSDNELFKSVQKSAKEYTRQTGSYAFGR